jgi:hypothetical protein
LFCSRDKNTLRVKNPPKRIAQGPGQVNKSPHTCEKMEKEKLKN